MRAKTQSRLPGGWLLWSITVATIAAGTVATLIGASSYPDIRVALQFTARTSFALFMLAFLASSFAKLWPSGFTSWLLVNRRYFGLSFAASHAIHLAVIVGYWNQGIGNYMATQPAIGFYANVIGYVVIAAMAATSFKASRQWLGPKAWSVLHTWGGYYIWLSFAKSYLPRALVMPGYWFPVVLLIVGLALRWAASRKAASQNAA